MSEITVMDICHSAKVSRSTFYRLFDTTIDVLEYASDTFISQTINDYSGTKFTSDEDFVLFSLLYWKDHTDMLEALVNCNRLDIVQKSFLSRSEKLIPVLKKDFSDIEMEYIKMGLTGLLTSLLKLWVERGEKESPAQLFELYRKFYSLTNSGVFPVSSPDTGLMGVASKF